MVTAANYRTASLEKHLRTYRRAAWNSDPESARRLTEYRVVIRLRAWFKLAPTTAAPASSTAAAAAAGGGDDAEIAVRLAAATCQRERERRATPRCRRGLKPSFHSNAIACVGKQPVMVATASTEHSYWLALAFVAWNKCHRKRLRFLRFSFTQRTQRKRLHLNGNRALVIGCSVNNKFVHGHITNRLRVGYTTVWSGIYECNEYIPLQTMV